MDTETPARSRDIVGVLVLVALILGCLVVFYNAVRTPSPNPTGLTPAEMESEDRTWHDADQYQRFQEACADPIGAAHEEFCAWLQR